MAKIIAIVMQKGGVGKTTTALNLGAELMHRGKRILFVDLDAQANLTETIGKTAQGNSILEVLAGEKTAEECITQNNGFSFIAGDKHIATSFTRMNFKILKKALAPIKENYDFIIIDTPPALGLLSANALMCADYVIIPAQAEAYSLNGLKDIFDQIEDIQEENDTLKVCGVLLNKYTDRKTLSRDVREIAEEFAKKKGTKVFASHIRDNTDIAGAQAYKMGVCDYAPNSNGAKDFRAFTDEFLKEVE